MNKQKRMKIANIREPKPHAWPPGARSDLLPPDLTRMYRLVEVRVTRGSRVVGLVLKEAA